MLDFSGMTIHDWSVDGSVGPQSDGTYNIPASAQPTNLPANTAGNPSITDPSAFDILKYGVGVVTDVWNRSQVMDYNKWMATNGGLYREGRNATAVGTATGTATSRLMLFGLLAVGGLILLTRKG